MADSLTQFLADPDQASRRAELAAFLGPRPQSYLTLYDRMWARRGIPRGNPLYGHGFSAAAFFLGPVWFFYRKMWLWAAGLVVIMLILGAIPSLGRAGLVLSVILALMARPIYLQHAANTIERIRRTTPAPDLLNQLSAAGGVSWLAGWISGLIFAAAIFTALFEALAGR